MEDTKIARVASIAAVGVALASLFHYLKAQSDVKETVTSVRQLTDEVEQSRIRARQPTSIIHKASRWGSLLIKNVDQSDGLMTELRMMSELTVEFEKIPNIIIDNGLTDVQTIPNPVIQTKNKKIRSEPFMSPEAITQPGTFVLNNARVFTGQMLYFSKKWLRAGVRNTIFFAPAQVRAAIVTCGGLAPGINTLIKELVVCLKDNYKVPVVYGIRFSFKGFFDKQYKQLNVEQVKTIHHQGGSYLGFSRSNADISGIVNNMVNHGINQLYIIGGQGSFRACEMLHAEIKNRKLNIAVCTIPKSVTNDIPILDRSFGFETAIEETQKAIDAAYVEAQSHENGVGIVKTMGKISGFLAVSSTIAARNTQACLVPEFPFDLRGEKGVIRFLEQRIKNRKCSVIVLSEGCNQSIRDYNLKVIGNEWDGEPVKEDIGLVLKREIKGYFAQKGIEANVKYIDPSYMVRDVPANAFDTKLCCQIAQSSVDGLMSGYTNFACGHVANKNVMIPIREFLSGNYSNKIQKHSKDWVRLLATTGQPLFIND